ncbi:hypothetical protein [Pseudoalteromonas phenolica]|nr:hypothetical protein [Pseudoalteromonas phenolica]
MTKTFHHFFILVSSLLAIACSDSDTIIHESSEKSESYLPPENCVDVLTCHLADGVMLWVDDNLKLQAESEFLIRLQVEQDGPFEIKSAKIDGKSMNMGYIPLFFSQLNKDTYIAQGIVGACDTDDMVWQIVIDYSIDDVVKQISLTLPMI